MPAPNDPACTQIEATVGFSVPKTDSSEPSVGEPFGDFVLHEELGRGGMGVVYKAFEPGLSRYVAVKMILSGTLSDSEELMRFHTEASAAARLQHSHIVKVHRVGSFDGRQFFSMDYIEGKSLAQRLADGPLPGRDAARYVRLVASAIHYAHEQGILHRDIKPANILVDSADEPHVTDFGLAKQLTGDTGQTRTGAVLGTPSYMSPEQARGEKDLTPAADIYGLGALLYELLTARPPFRGETPVETVMQVLDNDPAPPRLLNPGIDHDLETICLKCLAKSPADRYASAAALAADLDHYLEGESIEARSLNMLDYLGRTLQRSHFDLEFRSYGNLLLIFAAVIGIMHAAKFVMMINHAPYALIASTRITQFVILFGALWLYRPKGRGLLPATSAERLLWSVWLGYIAASLLTAEATRELSPGESLYRGDVYVYYAVMAGMAFFILGSNFWGGMYAVGAAFFALSMIMLFKVEWAVLEFGLLWAVALSVIGLRLRRLGREREQTGPPRESSIQTEKYAAIKESKQ